MSSITDLIKELRDKTGAGFLDCKKTLEVLAGAKTDVSNFFDNVIVNDEDEAVKKNRLELMQLLCKTFNNYLNFSDIESA